jgi:hypothetical protein
MATAGTVEVPKVDIAEEFEKGKNSSKYQHFYSSKT